MNLSQVVKIAKAFLPANSPWIDRIDQAAQVAQNFNPSKDGVSQLMASYGKNKSDLHKAVGMLENPFIKNALSRLPGLGNILNDAANELMNDPTIGSGKNGISKNSGSNSGANASFDSLQARLNRLK